MADTCIRHTDETPIPTAQAAIGMHERTTTRHSGGTGLGRAISRQIVERMHGTIDVTSGTSATVRPDDATPRRAVAHRVLVAEDNATNRMLISKMLEKYGCTVTLVTNGLEAVAALTGPEGHAFDIVLMDIQMPEMDGRKATLQIRAHEAAHPQVRRVPIVALTANGFPEDVARYMAAGMDTHLLKPIVWPQLFATIDALAFARTQKMEPAETSIMTDAQVPAAATAVGAAADAVVGLDRTTIDDLRKAVGTDEVETIVAMFAGELDLRLTRMRAACDTDGADAATSVAAEAHALASAARGIGAIDLADHCKDMERSVKSGDMDISPKLALILDAAVRTMRAIEALQRDAG